ncbi:GTPase [Clostridium estertheticum]|uniref:GTPase domain-containing protein n=1 Tax=Clostridium estertheticum TaxID=238834 RepID=A0AA47I7E5_9CLOT|nr:GTPase domain-containing protein [Clostridium estertheticum]MBU3157640.1 GTPase domain-containing protein [Clostridium estertheticum]WAG62542.1 GTPase domain-containing protein [Clostridium estertheticum]
MGLETNVLILGKTGVGKSSFINYIYGENRRATGTGKPVTNKGIFKETFELENITVNIYDSWGLEANKADSWEAEIGNYLNEHNESMEIKDWFHTIYYCFSTQSARIENFEINNILKPLINKGNKVSIILTHSDVIGANDKSKAMIDLLKEKLNIDDLDIIKVASERKKLLGGTVKEPFGRTEVLSKLKHNLWDDIKHKLPLNFEKYIRKELYNWICDSESVINNEVKFLNNSSVVERVIGRINFGLKSRFFSIDKRTQEINTEAIEYYIALINVNNNLFAETLYLSNEELKNANFKKEYIKFKYDSSFKFGYWAVIAVCSLLPISNLFVPFTAKHTIKKLLRKSLYERHLEVVNEIPKLVEQFKIGLEGNLNQLKLLE